MVYAKEIIKTELTDKIKAELEYHTFDRITMKWVLSLIGEGD